MKKTCILWLGAFTAVFTLLLFGYSLTMWGTMGLIRVNNLLQYAYLFIGVLVFTLLLLTALEYRHRRSQPVPVRKAGYYGLIGVIVFALVINLGAIVYVGGILDTLGDTPPRLTLTEGVQASGVPNLAVVFNTASANVNSLQWGEGDVLLGRAEEDKPSKSHVFNFSGLEPDTLYWYRLNEDAPIFFRTPPLTGKLKFAVISDTHFGWTHLTEPMLQHMLQQIAEEDRGYEMLFITGDLVEFGFRNSHWAEAFRMLGKVIDRIPFTLAAGNHDTLFNGIVQYRNYISPDGLPLENGSRLWRRISSGPVHFLIVDVEWSAETVTAAQIAWLEDELKSIPEDEWVIVLSHGYFYSSGLRSSGWDWYDNPETIAVLTPLFEKYHVDLVISGHNHHMEIIRHNDVTYAICGVFGGSIDPEREYVTAGSVWYSVAQHAYLGIQIDGDLLNIKFHGVDDSILFSYDVKKR